MGQPELKGSLVILVPAVRVGPLVQRAQQVLPPILARLVPLDQRVTLDQQVMQPTQVPQVPRVQPDLWAVQQVQQDCEVSQDPAEPLVPLAEAALEHRASQVPQV